MILDEYQRVLVLGAHPDDECFCAGTIHRLIHGGARVELHTFSDCADAIPEGFTPEDLISEWETATDDLGIKCRNLYDIPNRRFPEYRQEILDALIGLRDNYKPDLVLLPARSDAHQDHSTVRDEGIRAFKFTTVLGYELPMNTVGESLFNGFVQLGPFDLDRKVEHINTYRTQARRPYMQEQFVRGLAAVRGVQANVQLAEAFEVIRWQA